MRRVVGVLLLALLVGTVPAGASPAGANAVQPADLECAGTIAEPATGVTVISVQGARMQGENRGKTQARLVGVGPQGSIEWVHRLGADHGIVWSYDVDPLPNGNVFGTATRPGKTVLYELDVETGEWVWSRVLNFTDTHDADMLDRHRVLIAHMRNYNEATGQNDDRILIYNRTSDDVVWEWRFRDHGYDRSGGGSYDEDWTHVNDVDRIAEGRYLVSPRNFDQAIVVDRERGEITHRLGSDDDHDTMREQHNPQFLESESGRSTILVADSDNHRIVEYERRGGDWDRTWTLGSQETLTWPRDADRLPSGNTLVVDSIGHRVMEVTPTGEVVWEFYAPWLVYDAERLRFGDEAGGPTIADQDASGTYELSEPAREAEDIEPCSERLSSFENRYPIEVGTPIDPEITSTEATDDGPTTGETATDGQPGFGVVVGLLAMLSGWILFSKSRRD